MTQTEILIESARTPLNGAPDTLAMLALADHLDEESEKPDLAYTLRWMVGRGRFPAQRVEPRQSIEPPLVTFFWTRDNIEKGSGFARISVDHPECILPFPLRDFVRFGGISFSTWLAAVEWLAECLAYVRGQMAISPPPEPPAASPKKEGKRKNHGSGGGGRVVCQTCNGRGRAPSGVYEEPAEHCPACTRYVVVTTYQDGDSYDSEPFITCEDAEAYITRRRAGPLGTSAMYRIERTS